MRLGIQVCRAWQPVLAAVAGLAFVCPLAHAAGSNEGSIGVVVNGQPPVLEKVEDLVQNPDKIPNPFAWNPSGASPRSLSLPGASVAAVLALAHVTPDSLQGSVAIDDHFGNPANGGNPITLSKAEIIDGVVNAVDPTQARGYAVFAHDVTLNGDGLFFAVPMPAPGANSLLMGVGESGQGGSPLVTMTATTVGAILQVSVDASSSQAHVNEIVRFRAVPGPAGETGTGWTYSWDFNDNDASQPRTGVQVDHVFKSRGNYNVTVTAKHNNDAGVSAPALVAVDPVAGADGDNQNGSAGPATGSAASRRPVGGVTTDPTTPKSGTGTSTKPASETGRNHSQAQQNALGGNDGSSGTGGGSGGGSGKGSGGSGSGTAGGTSGAGSGNDSVTRNAAASAARKRSSTTSTGARAAPKASKGVRINGVLLAQKGGSVLSALDPASVAQAQARQQQSSSRLGQGSAGGGWPEWLGGAALFLALLFAGAAVEHLPARRREVWEKPLPRGPIALPRITLPRLRVPLRSLLMRRILRP